MIICLFSWPWYMIQRWFCSEKREASLSEWLEGWFFYVLKFIVLLEYDALTLWSSITPSRRRLGVNTRSSLDFSVAYQPSFAMRLSHLSAESKVNSWMSSKEGAFWEERVVFRFVRCSIAPCHCGKWQNNNITLNDGVTVLNVDGRVGGQVCFGHKIR